MTSEPRPAGPGRPSGGPADEEDVINRIKAIERSGREDWRPDGAGGYTDRDGHRRDCYGDPEGRKSGPVETGPAS